jgi:hypothetical protein
MARSYNGFMSKVIDFLNRYSVGKNSSVRELPDHEDPTVQSLVLNVEVDPESLSEQIKKSKERDDSFPQELHV